MSKKESLSERQKDLILEAQAKLLVADLQENGLRPDDLNEGLFARAMDFFTGGTYSAQQDAIEKGSKGEWAMAAASVIGKTKDLPEALKNIIAKTDEGIQVTKNALETITDEETKKFLTDSIEKSSSRIAAAQEEELNRIAKAVVKNIEAASDDQQIDETTKKAYVGIIVQAAMLGSLVANLK